jgi:2-dehydro-3-deoxyphosphogluconate aldolase / (4S)-4-hydroxy-2-oxoglutarate aldolase
MIHAEDILNQKIIPVYSDTVTANNKKIIKACYDAGMRCFEFTNRDENALDEFMVLKKYCDRELPEMMLGVGTVKNISDAEMFLAAGAVFLISPLISTELIVYTKKKNVFWVPGCATASEVGMAENAGISLVKIFPATLLGGAAFIKQLKGPFYNMQFMATGGITGNAEEIKKYFAAGVSAVGLGSAFFNAALPEEKLVTEIKNLLKNIS